MKRLVVVFALLAIMISPASAGSEYVNLSIPSGQILRGHFVQERHMQGFDKVLRTEGTFTVDPTNGLIWEAAAPFPSMTVITANGITQHAQGVETVALSAQKVPMIAKLYEMIGGVLVGNWEGLKQTFSIDQRRTAGQWNTILLPIKSDDPLMPFSRIEIDGDKFVRHVVMKKPGGDFDLLSYTEVGLSSAGLSEEEMAAFAGMP